MSKPVKVKPVAADCVKLELDTDKVHVEILDNTIKEAHMHLSKSEASALEHALFDAIENLPADATDYPFDRCTGTFSDFGLDCDKCPRYKVDCNGKGEFDDR